MHRRLGGDGGFARCRASTARRRSTRSGRAAATSSASTFSARFSARRRRLRPISPSSTAAKGESAALDAHVARAQGRHARPLGFRDSAPATSATGWRPGFEAAALVRAGSPGRRRLLPLAAREPRGAPLRRADRGRRQGDREAGGRAVMDEPAICDSNRGFQSFAAPFSIRSATGAASARGGFAVAAACSRAASCGGFRARSHASGPSRARSSPPGRWR